MSHWLKKVSLTPYLNAHALAKRIRWNQLEHTTKTGEVKLFPSVRKRASTRGFKLWCQNNSVAPHFSRKKYFNVFVFFVVVFVLCVLIWFIPPSPSHPQIDCSEKEIPCVSLIWKKKKKKRTWWMTAMINMVILNQLLQRCWWIVYNLLWWSDQTLMQTHSGTENPAPAFMSRD